MPFESASVPSVQPIILRIWSAVSLFSLRHVCTARTCSSTCEKSTGAASPSMHAGSRPSHDNDYFCTSVLEQSGLKISDDEPHTLRKDQSLIVQSIGSILAKDDVDLNVKKFTKSLEEYCTQESKFKKMLLPTKMERTVDFELISGIQQESVIRILLTVDCLQSSIIKLLLEKISNYVLNSENESNLLRLILRPLRFLPYVHDVEAFGRGILDITEAASSLNQLELVCILPDILPDDQHDNAAEMLSNFIRDDDIRLAAVDCLSHLILSTERQQEIRQQVLETMRSAIPFFHFPSLTRFTLADCSSDLELDTVKSIRQILDFIVVDKNQESDRATSQMLTFTNLRTITMRSRSLTSAWIQAVQSVKWHSDHRPFDIAILILIYSTSNSQKKIVEAIFRKRIKQGLFKKSLLTTTFTKYLAIEVIKEYLPHILAIASSLLQMRAGILVTNFASAMFILIFTHPEAKAYQQQRVVSVIVSLVGSMNCAALPLDTLVILAENNTNKLKSHVAILLSLLEKLDSLNLDEVRCVFDVLCRLAFSTDPIASLQDNLHILISKQLGSYKRCVKFRGVIGAIMAVKHMISNTINNESPESEITFEAVADLPEGPSREAAKLLETMMLNVRGHVEATGLAYDQLAIILRKLENLDKNFLIWLLDTVTNDFQNNFITESLSNDIKYLDCLMQYKINDTQEEESTLAVDIGNICLQDNSTNHSKMVILAPLFRLMRLLHHKQYSGDLTSINALLGCAVVLPSINNIKELSPDQVRLVLDCFFHCANWFREIISAFVNQKNDAFIHQKVLNRLSSLVKLETNLADLMQYAPVNYQPPSSRFPSDIFKQPSPIAASTSGARGRSKKKKNLSVTNTNISITDPSQPVSTPAPEQKVQKKLSHSCFRDLDTDILILLREPLHISAQENDDTNNWSLNELQFILEDLVRKLKNVMEVSKSIQGSEINDLHLVHPVLFIKDCIKLMPSVSANIIVLQLYIEELLISCDNVRDALSIFSDTSVSAKICFGLLLEFQALTVSWPELQSTKNINLLKDSLRAIVDSSHSNLKSVRELVAESTERVISLANICLSLHSAVSLVQLLQNIIVYSPDSTLQKKTVSLCKKLLSLNWYDVRKAVPDQGSEYNININILVKGYLSDINLDQLHRLVEQLKEECLLLNTNTDCLPMFPCIRKTTFPLLIRAVCTALVNSSRSRLDITASPDKHLSSWYTIAVILQNLVHIIKVHETKVNLQTFFRWSLEIFKLFLNRGMTIVEVCLRSRPDEVIKVLRTMQQSTRFLHSLCCHSKKTKDRSLIGLVPAMRLTLEALIYRVKAALVANNCSDAFWMGNLRNKDIHGEEILSQTTTNDSQTQEEEVEEDLPSDDNIDDIIEMD